MCDCLANIPDEQLFFEDRKGYATCVICMELIKENNQTTLECGHQYHASCYSENILSGNNHCALCREEVCREAEQVPELTKPMVARFMEQLLLQNKGDRMTQLFEELGYDVQQLTAKEYQPIIRILLDFGFNLGSVVREWIDEGNQRYVDQSEEYTIFVNDQNRGYMPDSIRQCDTYQHYEEDEEDDSATPPNTISDTGSDTGGDPVPQEAPPSTISDPESQEDDPPYDEIYEHLIERDRRYLREFLERFNLQAYEERILGCDKCSSLEHLLSCHEEDLMWPDGWSGRRPYFSREESQQIVGGILRYYSEVYDGSYNGMYGLL